MAIHAYINFNGNCREAVEYYANVFETEKPRIMAYGDNPQDPNYPMDEKTKELVMHTNVKIAGSTVMFSDIPPGMPFAPGNNISLAILSNNIDKLKYWFNQLKEGGTISMDLQETFWSKCYGFLTDKYGIGWQFNFEENDNF